MSENKIIAFRTRFRGVIAWTLSKKRRWSMEDSSGMKQKEYKTYSEYIDHQKSKLGKIQKKMIDYDKSFYQLLSNRLIRQNYVKPGMTVLCLAARIGTEVRAFLDNGCFALGIDLNPGEKNKYVVYGDFHDIQYHDKTFDIVFSNSFDHAFDLNKLILEIKRILKPNGYLILELVNGTLEGGATGFWESIEWKRTDDVLGLLNNAGFIIEGRLEFEQPWHGVHATLRLA